MSRLQVGIPYQADERPREFPFQAAGSAQKLFPPVCLTSHWDPTAMLRYILPSQQVELPMDFRPYVRICKDYVTSAPAVMAPLPPKDMVFPKGGEFYPPGRYSAAINNESKLFYLDRTLDRWCQTKEFVPRRDSDMYVPNSTVVRRQQSTSDFVQELAMPQAVLREDGYTCRTENDIGNWNRSPRLFNNPTKQDRYGAKTFSALPGGSLTFPHGGVEKVPLTRQAAVGAQITGSMREFGADGAGIPTVDASGCMVDASGNRIKDVSGNPVIDPSQYRGGLGAIGIPGGAVPVHIRPVRSVRPDPVEREYPIRIAGITQESISSYAPA
uniref:Uncharacterized protein n=1 Tax=viral metagenome TaxID=1070528 RepID=A0A6C0K320_9ZZZZ